MSIQDIVDNDLVQDASSVWLLREHTEFGYSDGVETEAYLERVFSNATDLSSGSSELEGHIKDWPSEYHLSAKRAQLFAGFEFDPSLKVLEVGCGCGAITRYLGETFNRVVSIEGSIARARLARLRTHDLENVSIVCAPFQEVRFSEQFDLIFCIGVYEYSATFVAGEDPYDRVLRYFSELLTPNGIVVMAIENQFGLKYFNSSREDHTRVMFEGLEGYHAHGNRVRTFGKHELEHTLGKHFSNIEMFYPYPDYKLPTCVIADEFLSCGYAGELVSQIGSRDQYGKIRGLWDESLVSLELSRNRMLPFFSNSFLVFAGKSEIVGVSFDQLAVTISAQRTREFRTRTRIYRNAEGEIEVSKRPLSGSGPVEAGKLALIESRSIWMDSHSLQTVLHGNCMSEDMKLSSMFLPCRAWVEFLAGVSEHANGDRYVDGKYIDCIFSNVYLESGKIALIDHEWVWKERIKLNVVVIRAIFILLCRLENAKRRSRILQSRSWKRTIVLVADSIGVELSNGDFADFVRLESEFQSMVYGSARRRKASSLRWSLLDRPSLLRFRKLRNWAGEVRFRIRRATAARGIWHGRRA